MISSAYALAGHYNEKLMDLIADQVCGLACWSHHSIELYITTQSQLTAIKF
jgi:hypothetical protein